MLSKIWKNLLLAICIIAILFNITSKLVNRISLEKTISSVQKGIDVKELLNIVEEEPVVEGSSVSTYNTIDDANVANTNTSETEATAETIQDENNTQVQVTEENVGTQEAEDTSKSGFFDITDISNFTTLLY